MDAIVNNAESIKRQARIQKRNSIIIRIMISFLLVISIIACIVGMGLLTFFIGPGLFSEDTSYTVWIILAIGYSAFFIIPLLFCLPVLLPLSIKNKNTSRIIVFRKFNDSTSKKALNKLIKSILGNYGHVFTLSDKNFKIKWYVRIPLLLGQMSFFHFRQRNIRKKNDLEKLSKSLKNRGWLNVNWYLSSTKVFSIKTTDQFWQDTTKVLLEHGELIVFDVSTFTEVA
jgi:hypothetical protein